MMLPDLVRGTDRSLLFQRGRGDVLKLAARALHGMLHRRLVVVLDETPLPEVLELLLLAPGLALCEFVLDSVVLFQRVLVDHWEVSLDGHVRSASHCVQVMHCPRKRQHLLGVFDRRQPVSWNVVDLRRQPPT
tara:strand:- start:24757 stop:25155 length:399 start_codon:yes stop_codon:yes gene_type:complete